LALDDEVGPLIEFVVEGACVVYTNQFQPSVIGSSEEVVFETTHGQVVLRVTRGKGMDPDSVEVWDLPASILARPMTLTLDEYETDRICFEPYEGA
jgi:hypothetical protein